jgi:hypothetical protein
VSGRRVRALAAAALLLAAACREGFFNPTPGATPSEPPATQLIAVGVRMLPGPEAAVRIGFEPREPTAHLRVERPTAAGRLIVCPLAAVDDPLPNFASCLPDLPSGVREPIGRPGIRAVALVREGDPITVSIRLEFQERSRRLAIRIPTIEPPPSLEACRDNACNPFFEVRPERGGDFRATARWRGGPGLLELLEGRVLARAFTATGIPYRVAATASGPPPLQVRARLGAPSEYALALHNRSTTSLVAVAIDASWP